MQAIGKLDDEHTDVRTGGDEELEQIVLGGGEISREVVEVSTGFCDLGDAVNDKGDVFAESGFNFGESKGGVFDGVMENAGDNSVFVHAPSFEDFLHSDGVSEIGFAAEASLTFVGFGCNGDGLIDAGHKFDYTTLGGLGRYATIGLCFWSV